ncbi:MAG TPA: protein kinase [Gemmatimonadales bacterium]|nr:protein kinase [Gemmatimonadales bacterium]
MDLREQLEAALGAAYTIESELGGGGMSRVFIAHEKALGRKVVVKLLPPELAASVNLERFRREILLAAGLQHPCIVPLLAAGEMDGLPYLTMPLVVGESLRARLSRNGAIEIPDAVRILRDIGSALTYAHEHGVVHRDIKPDNVLLSGGFALITDFGVAKAVTAAAGSGAAGLTSTGLAIGTPAYMAPEQVVADTNCDHRVDLYAFGMMGYEMIAGQHPFGGRPPRSLLAAQVMEVPPPLGSVCPETPSELAELIGRCLAKEPADRPQSAAGIMAALDRVDAAGRSARSIRPPGVRSAVGPAVGLETPPAVSSPSPAPPTLPRTTVSRPTGRMTSGGSRRRSGARKERPIDSLAILPFLNASANPDDEFLSDGIAETIINKLSRIPGLRVAARSVVFRYKDRDVDPMAAAKDMRVRAFVSGRVIHRGDALVVKVELVDTQSGSQLWGDQYNRPFADIFAVQEEMAAEISRALQLQLTSEDKRQLGKRETQNAAAYQAYLKGRYYWNQRTIEPLRLANRYFHEAIAADPAYAIAYAGLSDTYSVLGYYGAERPRDASPRARAAALRALEIDPQLAEAHASMAFVQLFYERDYAGAGRELERAMELDPGYATAHQWYGWYLLIMRRFEESVASFERALERDPLSLIINDHYAYGLGLAGRWDDAIEQCRKTTELSPVFPLVFWRLGWIYAELGRYEEAIVAYRRCVEGTRGLVALGDLGQAYGLAGQRGEARGVLARLEEMSRTTYTSPLCSAIAHSGIGEDDAAFADLERAYDDRASDLSRLDLLHWPDSMRTDARFASLLTRLGLAR